MSIFDDVAHLKAFERWARGRIENLLPGGGGTVPSGTIGSHSHPESATKTIQLQESFVASFSAYVSDTHGSLDTMPHLDMANSGTPTIRYIGVKMPSDWDGVTAPVLKILYSNSAAGNAVVTNTIGRAIESGDTGENTTALNTGNVTVNMPGSADNLALRSITFGAAPDPDEVIYIAINRVSADGADTSTGVWSIWSAWIEYVTG